MAESHHRLASIHLGNERDLWLRPPPGSARPARLAVFLDAERYRDPAPRMDVLPLLDKLVAAGEFADTFFVFVSEQSADARWLECPCHPPFARFIDEELLPWLEQRDPALRDVAERALIGLSYTGLAAAYVALAAANGRWTAIVSQSGSHWSNDEWLTARYRELRAPLPARFHLEVGLRETDENVRHREDVLQVASQIDAVRRFRDALRATGHVVNYVEFDGGHDYSAWRQTLPEALRRALSPVASQTPDGARPPPAISIRPAALADAPALARIHVETWRHAYRGIVPAAHLDSLSIEQRADRWTQILQKPVESTLVAERAGEILGWVSYGACREEGESSQAELYGIYLDARHLRAGTGRALMRAAETRLARLRPGAARITLWVFAENHPARCFYEALGYRPDGRAKTEVIGGASLLELRYAKPI